ncbi:MAG: FkbM family methyltransferase [Cytophaga sp.]|uniref:FkbM family methyltransferase n=1 Tax=Cytophaga sp. TaxID=29535 RepID=UPI003F7E5AB7
MIKTQIKNILLSLYALVPLKKQLFLVWRSLYIPAPQIFRHLYFKGIFKVEIDPQHTFLMHHHGTGFAMESDHFWKGAGACEKYSIQLWMKYVQVSDLILDIGANTGTYSLLASALNPGAEIHAFEPVKRIYEKLASNNAINHFNIQLHNVALSDIEGEIFLVDEGGRNEYTAHVSKSNVPASYPVKSIRLDHMTDLFQDKQHVLIKLDVEHHEAEVLSGMGAHLKNLRPVILLEVLDNEHTQRLNELFQGLNYVFLDIDEEKGYTPVQAIQKSSGNNIFCCPKEKVI